MKPSKPMEKNVHVVAKNTLNFWQLTISMVEATRKEERIEQYKHTNFIYGLERETTLKDTKFCVITATWQNRISVVALIADDFVRIKVLFGNQKPGLSNCRFSAISPIFSFINFR